MNKMSGGGTGRLLRSGLLLLILFAPEAAMSAPINPEAARFVRTQYKHGIPFAEAAKLGRAAVPTLLTLLADKREQANWSNIVTTLGIIGDDSATKPLIFFLEKRFQGEVDVDTLNALIQVPPALGFSAHRGNRKPLDYLLANAAIEKWENKRLRWRFRKYQGPTLAILLTKMVIRGLAVSGQPASRSLLIRLRSDKKYSALREHAEANITEGLELFRRLVKEGPEKTFTPEPHQSEHHH